MCHYDNTNDDLIQVLEDKYQSAKSGKTKVRPWAEKKMMNEHLAIAYDVIDPNKAARLRQCGQFLSFRRYEDGTLKLDSMQSCRVRLCPMCTWRRSLVNYANNRKIVEYVESQKPRGWILATFTLKRCTADDLNQQLDLLMYSWKKLMLNKRVKQAVKGAYRGVEITHDCAEYITANDYKRRKEYLQNHGLKVGDLNPTYDTYHCHIHAILCVNKTYWSNDTYMRHDEWVQAWQQAIGCSYAPVVNLKRIKPNSGDISGAVGEVSKYATKDSDVLCDDWDLTVSTVRLLDRVLNNRRFVSYSGVLLDAQKALKLKDADHADLTHIDGDDVGDSDKPYSIETYFWYTGYRQYGRAKKAE